MRIGANIFYGDVRMRADAPVPIDRLSDLELVRLVREGDTGAFSFLLERYVAVFHSRAARYARFVGADRDDFFQEGMFALYRAVHGFNDALGTRFSTYAVACINNSMSRMAKNHIKNIRHSADVRIDDLDEQSIYRQDSFSLPRSAEDQYLDSEALCLRAEQIEALLSCFERQVLGLYLRGHTYSQIANLLSTSAKAVDNALQRVRRKLRPEL